MDAAQHQRPRAGLNLARIGPVDGGDPPLHHGLLPEVGEVAGNEGDQERRARDRAVDACHLRGLDPDFLGDLGLRGLRPLRSDAVRPLE